MYKIIEIFCKNDALYPETIYTTMFVGNYEATNNYIDRLFGFDNYISLDVSDILDGYFLGTMLPNNQDCLFYKLIKL